MPITRQDAWTDDEDLMLAETVLRHIREGGTQLRAFEEVGKKLSRTGAACGFRWNSFVRKQYQSGIELAKKQRKELKKQSKKVEDEPVIEKAIEDAADLNEVESLTIEAVKSFLDDLQEKVERASVHQDDLSKYDQRVKELEKKVTYLSTENERLKEELKTIEGDHRALVDIMDRARKMVGSKEN
ncbi:RsfA family transcriptional regulator [Mesobacillus maritimus]|uniref:RsfA family transcriptional regulator n=1 Tax=Mesobacillus maritimus TaxID=1643336 RepID=A0ABS7K6M5_9BACI|nr:RsfA family transcriptional regulator [Mesobacillus maritimus]MBY0097771.1 RsfA family transcriptional regulator [Mesobacillus maritimus]